MACIWLDEEATALVAIVSKGKITDINPYLKNFCNNVPRELRIFLNAENPDAYLKQAISRMEEKITEKSHLLLKPQQDLMRRLLDNFFLRIRSSFLIDVSSVPFLDLGFIYRYRLPPNGEQA